MNNYELPIPSVVYFDPSMTDVMCFASWKFATDSNILIRQIQQCIDDEKRKFRKGIFLKIQPAFQSKMQSR